MVSVIVRSRKLEVQTVAVGVASDRIGAGWLRAGKWEVAAKCACSIAVGSQIWPGNRDALRVA